MSEKITKIIPLSEYSGISLNLKYGSNGFYFPLYAMSSLNSESYNKFKPLFKKSNCISMIKPSLHIFYRSIGVISKRYGYKMSWMHNDME